ncbi:kinase-like domain-containing protein [Rhizophagus irregularis DAOM 181602=DAOM 197198]|nr:kinase-like domain-containing protein [Rhizophagus irregularis DAOM 181602=DAOM 197198]
MDNFIFERKLKWIPYDKFKNVEYLDKGGFGTIYKAIWFYDNKDNEVILKLHNDLSENLNEFLNEWKYHESCLSSYDIVYFYGFTKDPDTLKYMVVMDYANKGNLRGNLTRIIKSDWNQKLYMAYSFDLGLCKPVKSFLKKYDIYGVIPFMAPEVLRGKSYTPASDIYSFSMIMWEFTSGIPPFNNRAHNIQLSLSICKGERPEIIENTPQCYVDLMKKCWDENPLKRPSSKEVLNIIKNWIASPYNVKVKDFNGKLKYYIMEFINAPIGNDNNLATESHSQAYYTSRLLDFTSKQLNEILESRDLLVYYSSRSTSGIVNEILESEDSQANVKVNKMLVCKDLDDCLI